MRASLVVAILSVVAWIFLAIITTPAHLTVDPSGYFPVGDLKNNTANGVFVVLREHFALALTVTITLAVAILAFAAILVFVITTGAPIINDIFGLLALIGVILLIIAGVINITIADTYDGAFSTWAKERYDIELEIPVKNVSFLSSGEVDTDHTIVLEDGRTVRVELLNDQNGTAVLAIVDADKTADELPVITDR